MNPPELVIDVAAEARALQTQGNRLLQLNQPQAALRYFDQALACDANDAFTLNDRGNALQDLQRFEEAIASYGRALQIKPDFAAAFTNRGNALRALKRLEEALLDLDAALRVKPAFPQALNNRGNILRDLGRLLEAVSSFDQALALKSDFTLAHCNRGKALLDLRRPREALESFEVAVRCEPEDGESLFGRASALLQLQLRLEQVAVDYDRAADRGIDRTECLVGKAAALAGLKRHGEAVACLAELLSLAPHRDYARGSWLHSRLHIFAWSDLDAQLNELRHFVQQGRRATHPQSLLSLADSPALQLECARVFVRDKYEERDELGPLVRGLAGSGAGKRIRVTYVSADFCEHPVSHLLVGALERHDRESFEVIGVSLRAGEGGPFEQRVRGAFDRLIEAGERSDREIARHLRELGVDIAVDLMGFTQGLRLGVFAHRCAPVQVNYLGYAGTLGARYMDYIVADEVVIPRGQEAYYSEQVVRLPHCYLPNDDRRAVGHRPSRGQAGLPDEGLVFCAFTNAYKINPPVFEIWMRLLRESAGSVLWLRGMGAVGRENLQREAQARGVAAERLVFAPHVASMAQHLGRQALADLYLDTLPYNAHSTACDALWAGVPVLTCAGSSFASRVAASALTALGMPELITHSLEEYERSALQLVREPERLARLRTRVEQQRLSAPLFDTARYTRELEAAYRSMHQRALNAEPAAAFEVQTQDVGRKFAVSHLT
jgi:predicted O-linked N-acetylglucosamine transferase (SPINDLY family)